MRNRFTLTTSTQLNIRMLLQQTGRFLLLSSILFVFGNHQMSQLLPDDPPETYYFSAKVDNFYENPQNWSPAYPGTVIAPGQKVVIQELAYVTGYDIVVEGELEIEMGGALFASTGSLRLEDSAQLKNGGELIFDQIVNRGEVHNLMGAKIHVKAFNSHPQGRVSNLKSAKFIVTDRLHNDGRFQNYSFCAAGELNNQAEFHQLHGAELRIDGKLVKLAMFTQ